MYAVVKTGGKQYRVEQGQTLLVERLGACAEGSTVDLVPLLYVDGDSVVDGEDLAKVSVSARVVGHERGPKLRVVKFKPKRGYRRRTGHRQELTRLEVTEIKLAARRSRAKKADEGAQARTPRPVAADRAAGVAPTREAGAAPTRAAGAAPTREAGAAPTPAREAGVAPTQEAGDGA